MARGAFWNRRRLASTPGSAGYLVGILVNTSNATAATAIQVGFAEGVRGPLANAYAQALVLNPIQNPPANFTLATIPAVVGGRAQVGPETGGVSSSAASSTSNLSSAQLGGTIGGSIGGACILFALVSLVTLLCRKRRDHEQALNEARGSAARRSIEAQISRPQTQRSEIIGEQYTQRETQDARLFSPLPVQVPPIASGELDRAPSSLPSSSNKPPASREDLRFIYV